MARRRRRGSALAPPPDFQPPSETRSATIATRERTSWSRRALGRSWAVRGAIRGVRVRRARARVAVLRPLRDAMRDACATCDRATNRVVADDAQRVTRALRVLLMHLAGLQRGGVDRGVAACWDAATILSMSAAPASSSTARRCAASPRRASTPASSRSSRTPPARRADDDARQHARRAAQPSRLAAYLRATAAEVAALEAGPLAREPARARAEGREGALAHARRRRRAALRQAATAAQRRSAGRWFAAV